MSEFTNPNVEVLISAEQIKEKIRELGADIARDYAGRDPLVKQHLTLLQLAMAHNNFYGLRVEWWHFTTADWKKYVPYWEDKQMSQTGDTPAPKS